MKKKHVRPAAVGPRWEPMQPAVLPGGPISELIEKQPGYVGVFKNNLYQVTYSEEQHSSFGTVAWLIIRRLDSEAVHDWRHFQRIKNELCGEECEAIEIYPAESRLVDESNQYHLFVFERTLRLPFGYAERSVCSAPFGRNKQRPWAPGEEPPDVSDAPVMQRLQRSTTAEQLNDHDNQHDHQQQVEATAEGIGTNQAQGPEDQ